MNTNFQSVLLISLMVAFTAGQGSPANGSVRLVDGTVGSEGRVEVYINGIWGTVCDDAWDVLDGTVVCAQLGYQNASEVKDAAYYGEGSGDVLLGGLECTGNETSLLQCAMYRRKNCQHIHDAGVICYPPEDDGSSLSPVLIGVIVLVPFLLLIVTITIVICAMIYLTLNYDRAAFEEEETKRRTKRFLKGLSLKEQTMLATKGRKGIFKSSRRRSDLHLRNMSGSSSFVDRPHIPRAALGEGQAHPWQVTEEAETDVDEDEVFMDGGKATHRITVERTVEAFNPAVMSSDESDTDLDRQQVVSVPSRFTRKRVDVENYSNDSDTNPYEEQPNID